MAQVASGLLGGTGIRTTMKVNKEDRDVLFVLVHGV